MNGSLVPIPKSSHGKFFSGNAYLILHVSNMNHFTSLFVLILTRIQIIVSITLICNSINLEQTNVLKTGVRQNFVHYWLGKDATEVHLVISVLIFKNGPHVLQNIVLFFNSTICPFSSYTCFKSSKLKNYYFHCNFRRSHILFTPYPRKVYKVLL